VPALLAELGLPEGEIFTGRRTPTLQFQADIDGEPYVLNYNLGNGAVALVADAARPEMDTKSFMQRLHLSRGYAPHWNVEWLWALIVDAMFLSMVFWGVSGLLMWWQIKRTRLLGSGFLVASLAVTVILVVGMHDSLTASGPRGGGGHGGRGGGARPAGAAAAGEEAGEGHNHGPDGHQHGEAGGEGMRGNRGPGAGRGESEGAVEGNEAGAGMRRGRGGRGGARPEGAEFGAGNRGGGQRGGRGGRGGMDRPADSVEPETAPESETTETL